MWVYFFKRVLLVFPTVLGITFVVFLISNLAPGGALEMKIAKLRNTGSLQGASQKKITQAEIAILKKKLHLDKPIPIAYLYWLKDIVRFDLGESIHYYKPVSELIYEKFPVSIIFGLSGFFISYVICIPLGVLKAIHHGETFDLTSSFIIFVTYSIPIFALAVLLLYLFASGEVFSLFPLGHEVSDDYESLSFLGKFIDRMHHMFLPVLCYTFHSFAVLTLLMKNSLLEEISKDYVRTAVAKGQSFRTAISKHAFRNSLIPIATGFGSNLSLMFAGSLIIELVFNIDGMGLLSFNAVTERDTVLMMGLLLVQSFLALFGNVLSDLCYVWIDPRIKFD
ncbi:MAG: ABC transporter permease subunit [Spirochaetota bacterium]